MILALAPAVTAPQPAAAGPRAPAVSVASPLPAVPSAATDAFAACPEKRVGIGCSIEGVVARGPVEITFSYYDAHGSFQNDVQHHVCLGATCPVHGAGKRQDITPNRFRIRAEAPSIYHAGVY